MRAGTFCRSLRLSHPLQHAWKPTDAPKMRTRRAEVERQPSRPQWVQVQVSYVPRGTD